MRVCGGVMDLVCCAVRKDQAMADMCVCVCIYAWPQLLLDIKRLPGRSEL